MGLCWKEQLQLSPLRLLSVACCLGHQTHCVSDLIYVCVSSGSSPPSRKREAVFIYGFACVMADSLFFYTSKLVPGANIFYTITNNLKLHISTQFVTLFPEQTHEARIIITSIC